MKSFSLLYDDDKSKNLYISYLQCGNFDLQAHGGFEPREWPAAKSQLQA